MPREFWELTLTEFEDLVEGYKWRDEIEWQRTAQLAVWTSQKLKDNTTADDLMGKNKKKKTTPEETRAVLLDLTQRLGGGKLGMG